MFLDTCAKSGMQRQTYVKLFRARVRVTVRVVVRVMNISFGVMVRVRVGIRVYVIKDDD